MKNILSIIITITISLLGRGQTHFELGHSFGFNGTISKTIKSDNMTWGYYTPAYPTAASNHWYVGWGGKKNKVFAVFDVGSLAVTWKAKVYTDKYPYSDLPSSSTHTNYSTGTSIKAGGTQNTNLIKLSLLYKHDWGNFENIHHKSIIGAGYLKTRVESGAGGGGTTFLDDSLGLVDHGMRLDKFDYFRNQNIYLTLGYEFSWDFGRRWAWNTSLIYNQGVFKMIRFHTYRTYSESNSGYTEFDEQWSVTRLSHYSILTGVSFKLGIKKRNI